MSLDSISNFVVNETIDKMHFGGFEGPNVTNITLLFKSGKILIIEAAIVTNHDPAGSTHLPALEIKTIRFYK